MFFDQKNDKDNYEWFLEKFFNYFILKAQKVRTTCSYDKLSFCKKIFKDLLISNIFAVLMWNINIIRTKVAEYILYEHGGVNKVIKTFMFDAIQMLKLKYEIKMIEKCSNNKCNKLSIEILKKELNELMLKHDIKNEEELEKLCS